MKKVNVNTDDYDIYLVSFKENLYSQSEKIMDTTTGLKVYDPYPFILDNGLTIKIRLSNNGSKGKVELSEETQKKILEELYKVNGDKQVKVEFSFN